MERRHLRPGRQYPALSRLLGADVRLVRAGFDIGFRQSWEQALAEVTARGGTPYAIPAGAADHPLGGLGFAGWAAEVVAQERDLGVFFDTVVVCSVTGSTQAGMIAGSLADRAGGGRPRRVLGIDGSATPGKTRDDRYHAGVYGVPDQATLEAMRLAARREGMITDPVYEGKSMAGLVLQ